MLSTINLSELPKVHHLKCWPEYFAQLVQGSKKFELRLNDRGFAVGDILVFHEFDPSNQQYSQKRQGFKIDYILEGDILGLVPGYCIMSISPVKIEEKPANVGRRVRNSNLPGAMVMRYFAELVGGLLKPKGLGFALFIFEFNRPGLCNYVSNAERQSMLAAIRETYKRLSNGQDIATPEEN